MFGDFLDDRPNSPLILIFVDGFDYESEKSFSAPSVGYKGQRRLIGSPRVHSLHQRSADRGKC